MSDSGQGRVWSRWFEIPASNFERAIAFYEQILSIKIQPVDLGTVKMGFFPHHEFGASICWGEHYQPGANGIVIYLDASPDLLTIQDKIEAAGGQILQSKKHISDNHGYMALFLDSEGNRLALHSMA
ncbi:MAG: VOC family protein [Calditrichaeota bacterium]|nr:VOC family protein [Calditrichota bacterium]